MSTITRKSGGQPSTVLGQSYPFEEKLPFWSKVDGEKKNGGQRCTLLRQEVPLRDKGILLGGRIHSFGAKIDTLQREKATTKKKTTAEFGNRLGGGEK